MEELYKDCTLCPRMCHADRAAGAVGYCRESAALYAARAALHMWEEPCISGVTGSGAVFFSGCNMGCVFCQNYDIAHGMVQKEISTDRLSAIFLELQEQNACNINLVTPTHFAPTIAAALRQAKEQGLHIPVVYNTSAYENTETLKMLDGLIDIYLPDCKYYSGELAEKYSGAKDYFEKAFAAIKEMVRQTGRPEFYGNRVHPASGTAQERESSLSADEYNEIVMSGEEEEAEDYSGPLMKKGTIIRHLLLPEHLDDSKEVIRRLAAAFGNDVFLSLMDQYTPMPQSRNYPELTHRVKREDYDALVDYAIDLGVEYAFIQGEETDKNSFIPAFDYRGL